MVSDEIAFVCRLLKWPTRFFAWVLDSAQLVRGSVPPIGHISLRYLVQPLQSETADQATEVPKHFPQMQCIVVLRAARFLTVRSLVQGKVALKRSPESVCSYNTVSNAH